MSLVPFIYAGLAFAYLLILIAVARDMAKKLDDRTQPRRSQVRRAATLGVGVMTMVLLGVGSASFLWSNTATTSILRSAALFALMLYVIVSFSMATFDWRRSQVR